MHKRKYANAHCIIDMFMGGYHARAVFQKLSLIACDMHLCFAVQEHLSQLDGKCNKAG